MNHCRGLLFDLDGTLYEGDELIIGALEAVEFCVRNELPFRFVTNTTSKPREEIAAALKGFGLPVRCEWIFTAPSAARDALIRRGIERAYFLLKPSLLADFEGIAETAEAPQAVVVGDMGADFTYASLNRAFQLLLEPGCVFLTLARNRYFKARDGLHIDVGSFVAALEYASGRESELVGKPAKAFFDFAVRSMGLLSADVLMVGDDLESDVLGAQAAGLRGILVRTGKFRDETLASSPKKPFEVWNSVAELPQRLTA